MKSAEHRKIPACATNTGGDIKAELDKINRLPTADNIKGGGHCQAYIVQVIPRGAENAITSAELMTLIGIQSKRTLAKRISEARSKGAVILSKKSGSGGYFLPDSGLKGRNEIIEWQRISSATAVSTLHATASASKALKIAPEQIAMEDESI